MHAVPVDGASSEAPTTHTKKKKKWYKKPGWIAGMGVTALAALLAIAYGVYNSGGDPPGGGGGAPPSGWSGSVVQEYAHKIGELIESGADVYGEGPHGGPGIDGNFKKMTQMWWINWMVRRFFVYFVRLVMRIADRLPRTTRPWIEAHLKFFIVLKNTVPQGHSVRQEQGVHAFFAMVDRVVQEQMLQAQRRQEQLAEESDRVELVDAW